MAVVERLTARFPDQQRSVIEEIVAEEHGLLDDGPIRDFIPVLVERAAKIRLSRAQPPQRRGSPAASPGAVGSAA